MTKTLDISSVREVFSPRPRICHKGDFGVVALFGGSVKYSGAVKLANLACAAMRGGCGVVRLAVEETLAPAVMPYLLESTLAPYSVVDNVADRAALATATRGVRAIGCGMGWEGDALERDVFAYLLSHAGCPLLADAGALRMLAEDPTLFQLSTGPMILTPHPGEFAALTGKTISQVVSEPVGLAVSYAKAHRCVVVLKGATTIVTDGEESFEVDRGGAGMATAGSGDVLAGVLTGMLGYLAPTPRNIAAGVFLTGLAGELAEEMHSDITMVASDTVAALSAAMRCVREGT